MKNLQKFWIIFGMIIGLVVSKKLIVIITKYEILCEYIAIFLFWMACIAFAVFLIIFCGRMGRKIFEKFYADLSKDKKEG